MNSNPPITVKSFVRTFTDKAACTATRSAVPYEPVPRFRIGSGRNAPFLALCLIPA